MPPTHSDKVSGSSLFQELRNSVAKQTPNFTFACGGAIPIISDLPVTQAESVKIDDGQTGPTERDDRVEEDDGSQAASHHGNSFPSDDFLAPETRSTSSLPVDLRWDSKDGTVSGQHTKVTFPLTPETESNLARLVADCEPATFGMGDQDVLDESYRKASKMDPTRFSSTFNPYEVGIVDIVAQTLLPTLRPLQQTRSLKAELYKLNFYSAPSGKFKAHVDTPRSPDQVGSLVVCLPLAHQGGALEVRHKGKTVSFDWSSSSDEVTTSPAIKWAAFYSDCEHEVLEVTEGHRLTLTYNLYVVRGNGFLAGHSPALDPTTFPLYNTIRDLVHDTSLWKPVKRQEKRDRHHIGYHCSHIYPHTIGNRMHFYMPDNLKGADMAMYAILKLLGLTVTFRPVFDNEPFYGEEDSCSSCDEESAERHRKIDQRRRKRDAGSYDSDSSDEQSRKFRKTHEHTTKPVLGPVEQLVWKDDFFGYNEENQEEAFQQWIGRFDQYGERRPGYLRYKDVCWINGIGHEEQAAAYLAYGNQHSVEFKYSALSMVAEIPLEAEPTV